MRRIPIIPTIVVIAAVLTMIGLGIWQLDRMGEKEALIAQYEAALGMGDEVAWPATPDQAEQYLFRMTTVDCGNVQGIDSIGGKSARGQSGWVYIARCQLEGGGAADVTIGWSRHPQPPDWQGGQVSGRIVPYGDYVRLIASEPQAGLEALAQPDPADLPNNHLAYAGQWFFFALVALIIYGLALRKSWAQE